MCLCATCSVPPIGAFYPKWAARPHQCNATRLSVACAVPRLLWEQLPVQVRCGSDAELPVPRLPGMRRFGYPVPGECAARGQPASLLEIVWGVRRRPSFPSHWTAPSGRVLCTFLAMHADRRHRSLRWHCCHARRVCLLPLCLCQMPACKTDGTDSRTCSDDGGNDIQCACSMNCDASTGYMCWVRWKNC